MYGLPLVTLAQRYGTVLHSPPPSVVSMQYGYSAGHIPPVDTSSAAMHGANLLPGCGRTP